MPQLAYIKCMVNMVFMRQVNIRRVDLNLLTVLDALLDERNVTRAARRLGMSQPAVSRAFARLRAMFDDDLLVEGAGGYRLSARAEEIVPTLRGTLAAIGEMLKNLNEERPLRRLGAPRRPAGRGHPDHHLPRRRRP